MPIMQFVGALLGAGIMVSVTSIIWPSVSQDPRPSVLEKVHDVVIQTPIGAQAESVLGASTTASQSGIGSWVSSQGQVISAKVQSSIQHAVAIRVIDQLSKQFDTLSDDEKREFQQRICEPPVEASDSGTQ